MTKPAVFKDLEAWAFAFHEDLVKSEVAGRHMVDRPKIVVKWAKELLELEKRYSPQFVDFDARKGL